LYLNQQKIDRDMNSTTNPLYFSRSIYFLLLSIAFTSSFLFSSCSSDSSITGGGEEEEMEEIKDPNDADDLELAPDFKLDTYDGNTISLADLKDKVSVIFFFGNACPPCKSVAPSIETKLNKEFQSNDKYRIIGIDQWDGNAASVERFKNDTGVTFPLAIKGSSVASAFGTTYDRLVVITTKGKVAFKGKSIAANDMDQVISKVIELLN
jgi:peroxiredoxin